MMKNITTAILVTAFLIVCSGGRGDYGGATAFAPPVRLRAPPPGYRFTSPVAEVGTCSATSTTDHCPKLAGSLWAGCAKRRKSGHRHCSWKMSPARAGVYIYLNKQPVSPILLLPCVYISVVSTVYNTPLPPIPWRLLRVLNPTLWKSREGSTRIVDSRHSQSAGIS